MTSVYMKHIESVRAEQAEFVATLTEQEKTEFLLCLLFDAGRRGVADDSIVSKISPQSPEFQIASSNAAPIRMTGAQAFKENFRARCGCDQVSDCSSESHGTAYVDVDYNYGVGRGRYDIVVRIRHYGRDMYGVGPDAWDNFVNAALANRLWKSDRLFGPGSPGRGGYFDSGNNQTPGRHTGALGVEVFEPGTDNQIWWGIWYFEDGWGDWGDQWLRCGHTYNFWFADN